MVFEAHIRMNMIEEPKVFSIDHEHLAFHDTQMEVKDIVGFCYGTIITQSVGLNVGGSHFYKFIDTSGDIICFGMMNWIGNMHENRNLAAEIEYWIWEYVGNRLVNDFIRDIHSAKNVLIGEVTLNRNGVHFTDKRYSGRTHDYSLDWDDVVGYGENGWLLIRSKRDAGISFPLDFRSTINALVLYRVLSYIETNLQLRQILRGLAPPLV